MYNQAGTPFGGKKELLQTVRVTEETVTILPTAMLVLFTVLLLLVGMLFPAAIWIKDLSVGRTKRLPELWEAGIAFSFEILALIAMWMINGQSLVIDAFGVEWRFLFRKHRLRWREIHDFGLSYAYWGQVRLYFAEERLETNGRGKKRMVGRHAVILIHIQNRNKTGKILNVCRQYTRIRPFLCSEEGKLAGILKDR